MKNTPRPSHNEIIAQTGRQLQLIREGWRRPAATAGGPGLLREDVQNLDNTARAELQQAMTTALGSTLEIAQVEEKGGVRTVTGLLRLGQDVHFSFTSQQPDGCYISCQNLEVSERTAEILAKLQAYFTNWYSQSADAAAQPGVAPAV